MESGGRPRHLRSRRPQRHGRSRAGHAGGRHPDPTGAPRPAGLRLRPLPRGLRSGVDRPRRRSGAADLPGSHGQGHRRPRSHVPVPRLRRATRVRRDPPLAPVVPRRRPHERRARHPPVLASPRLGARPRHHHRPLEGRVVLLRPPRLAHRSTTERRGDRCALRRVTTSLRPRPLRHPVRRPHGGAAPITGPPPRWDRPHGGTAPTPGRPHGRATPITRAPPRWDRSHAGPPPRQGRPHHRAAPKPGRSYHRARPTPGHPPPRRPRPAPTVGPPPRRAAPPAGPPPSPGRPHGGTAPTPGRPHGRAAPITGPLPNRAARITGHARRPATHHPAARFPLPPDTPGSFSPTGRPCESAPSQAKLTFRI